MSLPARDLLWVIAYAPRHGGDGTPIAVTFASENDLPLGIHVRLVVGHRAVRTTVHQIDHAVGCARWQLTGHAPSLAPHPRLPLTIQAVDGDNRVVDSVTFGDFLYTTPHTHPEPTDRHRGQPHSPPSSDSEHVPSRPALRRASRQPGAEPDDTARTVVLDITTPLDSFCFDWDDAELHAGRRLVRFKRLQDGNRLIVSAERISQAEYDPDHIVVSCIYREETDSCCVTSVDIIHLLQLLVEADFEVDEKNRIRRNLEGLRPTTVSKTRPGFESFFQRIMDFPDPKPRKIEKDVKVFDWKLLPHALDKILSKYSLCASPPAISPKNDGHSPSVSKPPQGTSTAPLGGTPTPSRAHFDALYPVIQLPPFTDECTPDASPETHRRPSLHKEQLQPVYLDMQGYFPEPDIPYRAPPSSGPLQPPMYTPDGSTVLARTPSTFVGENEWAEGHTDEVLLASPQELVYPPAYGYDPSDPAEPVDIYTAPSYPINTYDSFEFQTLREHNTSAMLASQHA